MRAVKLSVAVSVFLVFAFSGYFAGHAEETKQEAAPPAGPDVKQELQQGAAPAPKSEVQPASQPAEAPAPGGPGSGEKRFVAIVGPDGVQRADITGGEYYFEPNHIVLKVNVPAELKVKKSKDTSWFIPHDIVVKAPEAGIDFKVSLKKEPQTVKFTPVKAGTFAFYCDKKPPFGKSHKDKGMNGVIEVVE
jgi:plastocyanin